MVYSSRVLAFILALSISVITSLFLSLVESVDFTALIVAGIISFSVSYILAYFILEFLIFREINKMYKLVDKLKKKELSGLERQKPGILNPLEKINEEIFSFAEL